MWREVEQEARDKIVYRRFVLMSFVFGDRSTPNNDNEWQSDQKPYQPYCSGRMAKVQRPPHPASSLRNPNSVIFLAEVKPDD